MQKILLIVKLSMILMTAVMVQVHATGLSQSITLSGKNLEVKDVFAAIKQQTGYVVFYKKGLLTGSHPVTVTVHDMPLNDFLNLTLRDQPFTWLILDKTISLERKAEAPRPAEAPTQSVVKATAPPPVTITGHILDADGNPLAGASVQVKHSRGSTITRADGSFTLDVNEGDVLVISYIGYAAQEVRLTAKFFGQQKTVLSVRLQQSNSDLDQVQVLAHGTTTKRMNPGDVTTITAQEIAKNPVTNVLEAIQGKVPGLFIQQATGQPGGAFTFQMRSANNFSTTTIQPLVVVDGVRYPSGTLPLSTNSSFDTENFLQNGSGLNYINPNDIESIDVLKDADATATYGSSGAYGVIIITTKKAKLSNPALSANVYSGVSVIGEMPKLMNTQQYLAMRNEAVALDSVQVGKTDYDINGTWPANRFTDWRKLYLGASAENTNADLAYSGGSRNTAYTISGNLREYGNIQRHKGSMGDGTLRFSMNTGTTDGKFNLNLTASFFSSKSTMVPFDFSMSSFLDAPNAPSPFLPNGNIDWNDIDQNGTGDAANFNRNYSNNTTNWLFNGALVYKPVTGLTLRAIFGYNDLTGKELIEIPTTTMAPYITNAYQQTHSIFNYYDIRTFTVSPYAEYDRPLFGKGDLSIKAGGEIDDKVTLQSSTSGTIFASDALLDDPAAGSTVVSGYNSIPFRSLGFYGIIKYVWDKKYILDLNGRRDGSTRFGPDNRFGNFGSVAAAWIFSEEAFIKDHVRFLSFGKLRASTGVVGGDAIKDYQFLSTYTVVSGTYDGKLGLVPNAPANPYLKWEHDRDQEIGLELGFFRDRIIAEGNYYRNTTSNQLVARPISSVTGSSTYVMNSDAVIRNSGWELSLSTTNVRSANFSWVTRFNFTIPTSKLLRMPTIAGQNNNFVLGKPLSGVLLYKYNGVNPATGYFSFTNGKGVTGDFDYTKLSQTADRTQFFDLAPRYYGGFTNSFTYKQLSLDVFFSFTNRLGENALAQSGYLLGGNGVNGTTQWLNRWHKPGDKTDVPRVSTNLVGQLFRVMAFETSTGAYTDATYARLQNVSLRYQLDKELVRRMHLKGLTVYIQGQNLLTISKFGGLDPENMNAGVIPPLRVFTGGINLSL